MKCQKDLNVRWTKKHGKSYYGYKNHINVDKKEKLIRRYKVTEASVHDSQAFDDVLMKQTEGVQSGQILPIVPRDGKNGSDIIKRKEIEQNLMLK